MSSWNTRKPVEEAPSLLLQKPRPHTPRPSPCPAVTASHFSSRLSRSQGLPNIPGFPKPGSGTPQAPSWDFSFSFLPGVALSSPGPNTCQLTWLSSWPHPLMPFKVKALSQGCAFSLAKKHSWGSSLRFGHGCRLDASSGDDHGAGLG